MASSLTHMVRVAAANTDARMITPARRSFGRVQRVIEPSLISVDEDIRMIGAPNFTFEPIYRVILHFTQWNDNKEVARRVVRAVPAIGLANATRIVESAVSNGSSIVVTSPIDEAQLYQTRMNQMGLKTTLEMA